jgi:UDP-N-acetylmuramoylalanine--D-glutamate ligase
MIKCLLQQAGPTDMKVAIVGFGDQAQAAYEYWDRPENDITILDMNPETELPSGVKSRLGDGYLENLGEYDLLIRTPSVRPDAIEKANPGVKDILDRVTSVTNEFFKVCPTKNIIGITGTKGKGTTSTLITKILEESGLRAHLGGNIGIPPLSMLKNDIKPSDWVVLELANFQLIDLKYSPVIGVCLMVVPEHLDWHPDVQDYIKAKQQMFRWQKPEDIAVYNGFNEISKEVVSVSSAQKLAYMQPPAAYIRDQQVVIGDQIIVSVSDIKLLGEHNLENVCAALSATWQVVQDVDAARRVIISFTGLEHRLQSVRDLNGVSYYDDSFGTAPETAMVAVKAFKRPIVLILGGSDKGATYQELAKVVANSTVKHVITIGTTGPAIEKALRNEGFSDISEGGQTMTEIVKAAQSFTAPDDVVLLSTGCASFGLFKNYKDRGDQFHSVVNDLN